MPGYLVSLDLAGRLVVVVGAGRVAARRLPALRGASADLRVIAPLLDPSIAAALGPRDEHRAHAYRTGDLDGARLALATTDDPAVNAAVASDAEAAGIWCVRADDGTQSSARVPATAHTDDLTIAVITETGDPRRAVVVRDAIRLLLDTGELPLRRHRPGNGRVSLVGGGPGDPGLITVRGRQRLAEADVVVVDKLAPREWLASLPVEVAIIEAGKSPHSHNMTQDDINAALVAHALAGARVVRLKGGDPYVFGRGGEELLACLAAGIDVEVVPGVTSALAVPAQAGIPLTHRGVTQEFTVVSAHLDPAAPGSTVDYDALGRATGTLVFLMGVGRLARIAAELVARGRRPQTPVAVIESGGLTGERVTTGTLADIAILAAGAVAPAVIVVGDVVALREAFRP